MKVICVMFLAVVFPLISGSQAGQSPERLRRYRYNKVDAYQCVNVDKSDPRYQYSDKISDDESAASHKEGKYYIYVDNKPSQQRDNRRKDYR